MIINEIMPSYDVRELHWGVMGGTQAAIYSRIRTKDLGSSRLIRWLFKFRGLPESALSIDGLFEVGFIRLAEEPGREFMVGIIGRFWKGSGDLKKLSPPEYSAFEQPGYNKAVWHFSVEPVDDHRCRVATETRVISYGRPAKLFFRIYWQLIAPFSGLIRREMLKMIEREMEKDSSQTRG
jgi:hypothetical protein